MSPPSKRLVLRAGQSDVVLWRQSGKQAEQVARHEFEREPGGADSELASLLVSAIAIIASSHSSEFLQSRMQVLLDRCFCPGLMVDLGEQLLPRRVRQAFLAARFAAMTGPLSAVSRIRSHPSWITGAVLGFGLNQTLNTALEDALRGLKVRSISIQPTFVWCWNQRDLSTFTGLFVSGSGAEISMAYCREGRPISFDSAENNLMIDWAGEMHRQKLLHGITDPTDQISLVGLPDFELPEASEIAGLKMTTFAALGVAS